LLRLEPIALPTHLLKKPLVWAVNSPMSINRQLLGRSFSHATAVPIYKQLKLRHYFVVGSI
jgi:hypothetical protein